MDALLSKWGIDHEVDLSVPNVVYDVWAPLLYLVNALARNTEVLEAFIGTAGCKKPKAHAIQWSCDAREEWLVLVAQR